MNGMELLRKIEEPNDVDKLRKQLFTCEDRILALQKEMYQHDMDYQGLLARFQNLENIVFGTSHFYKGNTPMVGSMLHQANECENTLVQVVTDIYQLKQEIRK